MKYYLLYFCIFCICFSKAFHSRFAQLILVFSCQMSAIHVYILHHFWVPAVYFKLLNQGIWLRWSVYVFLFLFLISLKMTFSSPLAEYFALSLHLSLSSLRLPSSLLYSSSWPEFPSTFLTFLGVTFFLFSPLALFPFHYLFFFHIATRNISSLMQQLLSCATCKTFRGTRKNQETV